MSIINETNDIYSDAPQCDIAGCTKVSCQSGILYTDTGTFYRCAKHVDIQKLIMKDTSYKREAEAKKVDCVQLELF